jgi:hypothetical protein
LSPGKERPPRLGGRGRVPQGKRKKEGQGMEESERKE